MPIFPGLLLSQTQRATLIHRVGFTVFTCFTHLQQHRLLPTIPGTVRLAESQLVSWPRCPTEQGFDQLHHRGVNSCSQIQATKWLMHCLPTPHMEDHTFDSSQCVCIWSLGSVSRNVVLYPVNCGKR